MKESKWKKKLLFKSVINMVRSISEKYKHWKVISHTAEDHSLVTSKGGKVHFTALWFFTGFIHFIKVPEISLMKLDFINYLRWAKIDDFAMLFNEWTSEQNQLRGKESLAVMAVAPSISLSFLSTVGVPHPFFFFF